MRIASRLARIKPSATLAVSAKAMELRAQGRKIISLSVGEPDFPTPEHICQAAKQAVDDGFTRYTQTPGIPELRSAAANWFTRFYGVDAPMEATIITNGGKQGLYNLFQALLEPGDEVLIPAPYWVSYPAMVMLADGEPVPVSGKGFKLTVDELERGRTEKTKAIILNSPSNPTGAAYSQAELDAIIDWAVAKGLFVVSDEIYDRLVYEPAKPASAAKWWKSHPESVAVVNGLAKTFAMTGWRVGYVLAHPDLIKALSKIQGQSTSNICSIAQKAALAALTGPMDAVDAMRSAFEKRREVVMTRLAAWKACSAPKPDGAFYAFVDMSKVPGFEGSTKLCERLLEEASVASVPGEAFGDDRFVRFSYALAESTMHEALDKIEAVLPLT